MLDDEEIGVYLLIIKDIVFEDVGMYKCVVINEEGEVLSKVVLVVKEVVNEFIFEVQEGVKFEVLILVKVGEGDIVSFSIVIKGKFVFIVDWFKDDQKFCEIS